MSNEPSSPHPSSLIPHPSPRLAAHTRSGSRHTISFSFDGWPIAAYQGDTVAAALFASGVRIFTRSFKYHRPRGLLCGAGRCPNCLMNVDGAPNVRTCVTPVREGMQVRHQNAWPSLERDALSALGLVDRLLPVGFYYKTFLHPRALWPLYERVLKHAAGLGVVQHGSRPEGYHHEYRSTDVAVVGGGPAGMAAALAAAQAGCRVSLVEEQEALGGMLRGDARARCSSGEYAGQTGSEVAAHMAAALEAAGVTVWTEAAAFGAYEGGQLGVQRGPTLIELRYRRLVLATGAFERPAVFAGNDLPGIMLGTGAQRLLRIHGIRPGRRAVIATSHDGGLELAEELLAAGVAVAAVADTRSAEEQTSEGVSRHLLEAGVRVLTGSHVTKAHGRRHLKAVDIGAPLVGAQTQRFSCDLLCLSLGWEPALALLAQAMPGELRWDSSRAVSAAGSGEEEILAAGSVTGAVSLEECLALGTAAGRAAAARANANQHGDTVGRTSVGGEGNGPETREVSLSFGSSSSVSPYLRASVLIPEALALRPTGKQFVCLCEDVLERDIAQAVDEGFDHIELLKRYSTASMGPCQGKMCRAAVSELCAQYTGRSPEEVGMSRARPPAQPVTMGALGAAHASPVRRTPMHDRHLALGARLMDLGEWKRPETYTSVEEECRAVRERVGLIDVSTLGKLEVVGKEAAALLEKVYTNRFHDLQPGRVRYGVVCDDAGIILDDGTFARLAEDRWFITTTSGGVEAMDQWLRWWAAPAPGGQPLCAHVTNVTAGLAAVNLAGPHSREVLARLTDLDLARDAFPYLGAREGQVAGVPALLLRIGFVGELGYEVHYPAEYGVHVWDALMEAGQAFDIRPFGVEAQRVLRLEKQHLIVGHDTDALSTPLDAGMPWIVKWEKEEFVGRTALLHNQERAAANGSNGQQRLVGFTVEDDTVSLPEGSQVVRDGSPVGRVTSYRRSPTLGKGIGIAWVPREMAGEGAEIRIAATRGTVHASVTLQPFYDPAGIRVRS